MRTGKDMQQRAVGQTQTWATALQPITLLSLSYTVGSSVSGYVHITQVHSHLISVAAEMNTEQYTLYFALCPVTLE